jgi:hypothetical protein
MRNVMGAACFAASIFVFSPAFAAERTDASDAPTGHFSVSDPAELDAATAEVIYGELVDSIASGYALSQDPAAQTFTKWPRHNTAPYRSATHGKRFVNNYGNRIAEAYGRFEGAGALPVGALLAKDSFSVAKDGTARPGPLFLMEKMAEGFNPESGDWRYSMIMPDGSLFGVTNGENSDKVAYCIGCHAVVADNDHLFFVPEEFRRTPK